MRVAQVPFCVIWRVRRLGRRTIVIVLCFVITLCWRGSSWGQVSAGMGHRVVCWPRPLDINLADLGARSRLQLPDARASVAVVTWHQPGGHEEQTHSVLADPPTALRGYPFSGRFGIPIAASEE